MKQKQLEDIACKKVPKTYWVVMLIVFLSKGHGQKSVIFIISLKVSRPPKHIWEKQPPTHCAKGRLSEEKKPNALR